MSLDSIILEEAYEATITIIDDPFVYTQILTMVNIGEIIDFKSACQGYFCAMYVRNVTMMGFKHKLPMTYQPNSDLYNQYYKKITKNENIEKNIQKLI